MQQYRVYALIHGQILPVDSVADCRIEKMSFKEQNARSFSPIEAKFSDEVTRDDKTYVTSLPYVDPLKIKSEYVAIYDLKGHDPLAALGGAIRQFEKLCRFLFIANAEDVYQKFGGKRGHACTYLYQVTKIYEIDQQGREKEAQYEIRNRGVYLPNRPDANDWRDGKTPQFLSQALAFHDEIFKQSLGYLYKSTIGYYTLHSREKIALDHFKSIEVIVNSLSTKRSFTKRLQGAATIIGLTSEEQERIKKLWTERSDGDVAHSKEFDISERYPNQFPILSNTEYSGFVPDAIAEIVCLKYYRYKRTIFGVEVEYDEEAPNEGRLTTVNEMWESNRLFFWINQKSTSDKEKKLISSFARAYGLKEKDLKLRQESENRYNIQILK